MRITEVKGIILIFLCSLSGACHSNKTETLSAPEKRIHLDAQSLAPPVPSPPSPSLRDEINVFVRERRKKFVLPLISLTPQQREQLHVTAYIGDKIGCGTDSHCFLHMRYTRRKQITVPGQINSLLAVLNDPENYDYSPGEMGCSGPGVGLHFEAPGFTFNVLIEFVCRHLYVDGDHGNQNNRILSDSGVTLLKKEFKPIFPNKFD